MREQKTTRRGAQIEQNLVFAENVRRLLGVHDLEQTEAARLLGLSKASFSAWNAGRRRPSFPVALSIAEFFEIPADRLATAEFGDLLTHELADRSRFESVERKILADLERGFESAAGPSSAKA
jgi:DNA-binding XRE family transcriptional regulator